MAKLGKNLSVGTSLTRELDVYDTRVILASADRLTYEKLLEIIKRYNIPHQASYLKHTIRLSVGKDIIVIRLVIMGNIIGAYLIDGIVYGKDAKMIKKRIFDADISDNMKELLLHPGVGWINIHKEIV